jgi:hypothetical protein
VEVVLPAGARATTRSSYSIDLTRVEEYANMNFGIGVRRTTSPSAAPLDAVMASLGSRELLDPLA